VLWVSEEYGCNLVGVAQGKSDTWIFMNSDECIPVKNTLAVVQSCLVRGVNCISSVVFSLVRAVPKYYLRF
jgi:hypothetical protein